MVDDRHQHACGDGDHNRHQGDHDRRPPRGHCMSYQPVKATLEARLGCHHHRIRARRPGPTCGEVGERDSGWWTSGVGIRPTDQHRSSSEDRVRITGLAAMTRSSRGRRPAVQLAKSGELRSVQLQDELLDPSSPTCAATCLNPHFSSTRIEATFVFTTSACSGRASTISTSSARASVASPRSQNSHPSSSP